MEKKVYELKIDPELRDYVPALKEDEYLSLRDQIIEQGCMDPLTVWDGFIVDGHNRYRICRENNIPFAINEVSFPDKAHAKKWMADRQLGRRNLNPYQRCELVFPLEDVIREEIQGRKKQIISYQRQGLEVPPNLAGPQTTRDAMAQKASVSHGTWDMARALITEASDDIKAELRAEKLVISKAYSALHPKEKPPKPAGGDGKKQKTEKDEVETKDSGESEEETRPTTRLDEPMEFPPMRDEPERTPRPFEYVRDQVHFAVENLLKELKIGLNWLRDEDAGKADELVAMLDDGYSRAVNMIEEAKNE